MKQSNPIIPLLFLMIILGISVSALADSKSESFMQITYKKPVSSKDETILKALQKEAVSELTVEVLGGLLKAPKSLTLVYGGKDGPLYDSENKSILIPYSFIHDVKKRFQKAKYAADTGVSLNDAVMDVVMHTILHEMGHALIDLYDLPVVTKEEDTADSLATMLLIEYFEDGQEVALTAADLFDLESDDIEEFIEEDFWDEHSLDVQRYYSTLCYIYGSDPKKYADLKKDANFSKDRAELCVDEYEQIYFGWKALLKTSFKKTTGTKQRLE